MSANCAHGSKEAQERARTLFPYQSTRPVKYPAAVSMRTEEALVTIDVHSVVAQGKVIVVSGIIYPSKFSEGKNEFSGFHKCCSSLTKIEVRRQISQK